MRRTQIAFVLSIGLIAAGATSAEAASSRAEYIAQVDPICQAFVGPVNDAIRAYSRDANRLNRARTRKAIVSRAKRTARSLNRSGQIHASMTGQIVAVAPTPEDSATVSTWIKHLTEEDVFVKSAASALKKLNFKAFNREIDRVNAAYAAARRTISGFGFQVCGTTPGV